MKKSLLALAVLGAFAGVASAQSSVTLFGTVDVGAQYVKNDGRDASAQLSHRRHQQQPLGFQGIEDLGGGLKAGFNIRCRHQRRDTRHRRARQVLEPSFDGQPVQQRRRTAPRPRLRADVLEPDDLRSRSAPTASAASATFASYGQAPSGQLDRLLPAVEPGWLLRPGHGRRCRERHDRSTRPAATSAASSASRAGPFDVAFAASEVRFDVAQAANAGTGVTAIPAGDKAEDLQRRRLVGLRLPEADGLLRPRAGSPTRKEKLWRGQRASSRSARRKCASATTAASSSLERRRATTTRRQHQGHVPVQPVEADRDVRHGRAPGQQGRHDRLTLPGAVAADRRPRVATRRASSSAFVTSSDRGARLARVADRA